MIASHTAFVAMTAAFAVATAAVSGEEATPRIRTYQVDKPVADLAPANKANLSSPEAAYASIHRMMASGKEDWPSVSAPSLAGRLPKPGSRSVREEERQSLLDTRVLEVRVLDDAHAGVIARTPGSQSLDIRAFGLVDGRWLNEGNDRAADLDAARLRVASILSSHAAKPKRAPVKDPDAMLARYVEYLHRSGRLPKEFILEALAGHKLVIIGEIHHRPTYWELNRQVVEDPLFAQRAQVVYLELPAHAQPLVNRFLAAPKLDAQPVIEVMRDMMEFGWPDGPTLDFFKAVWKINQQLPADRRIRIVLVDMARPWAQIRRRADLKKVFDGVDRNQVMADNILKDLATHPQDARAGLFIVGFGHAELNLRFLADPEQAVHTAGWLLRRKLGPQVYHVLQHGPVLANVGGIGGRAALGLFDSAFAAQENRPVAFALAAGPFGEQLFDIDADWASTTSATFADVADAYVYLGPLEQEIFSSLIDGFYTDEFVKEVDRRQRLMNDKGLVEGLGLPAADGRSFIAWMSHSWGRPREWTRRLGPVNAWRWGDGWQDRDREEHHRQALDKPEIIRAEAQRLLDGLAKIDYANAAEAEQSLLELNYRVYQWHDRWQEWVCDHFKNNPIQSVQLGGLGEDVRQRGLPGIHYSLVLKDGSKLEGFLPFEYQPLEQSWEAVHGLDWHLQERK